jgi:hypothetical protein
VVLLSFLRDLEHTADPLGEQLVTPSQALILAPPGGTFPCQRSCIETPKSR